MLCTASDTFRILVYSALCFVLFIFFCFVLLCFCFFRYKPAYSIIFSDAEAYSRILRHDLSIIRLIQTYSVSCVTLTSSHIWAPAYLEPEAWLKPWETLSKHIQSPAIGYYSAIFKNLCNACMRRNLAYLESWNTQNPSVIAFLRIFRTLSY